MLDIDIASPKVQLSYKDKILLVGSCFTEEIGVRLKEVKFNSLQNPNGILYDPFSICRAISSWIGNISSDDQQLVFLDELWHSWQHHSVYSGIDKETVIKNIQTSTANAHHYLKQANWLLITLGSSIHYSLAEGNLEVANCHKAPSSFFEKKSIAVDEIASALRDSLKELSVFNPSLQVILTVSPVRHTRDGLVENTRSKARLVEAIGIISNEFSNTFYFPAFELVMDVLRDYRFYETDLVHPNAQAADFVFEKFIKTFINPANRAILEEIKTLVTARKHRPFHPSTEAHQKFRKSQLLKANTLQALYPYLDLKEEITFFTDN